MSKTIAIVTGARRGAGRGIAIALEGRRATVDVRAALSGKTVIGAELALQYGVTDEGGRQPLLRPRHAWCGAACPSFPRDPVRNRP